MNKYISLLTMTVFLLGATQTFANHGKGGKQNGWPCADDVKKLCGTLSKDDVGHGAIIKCLNDNQDKLSDKCKVSQEKMKAAMQEFNTACKGDMDALCKDIRPEDMRAMHECMKTNKDKLSDTCKAQHAKMKEKWEHHRKDKKAE